MKKNRFDIIVIGAGAGGLNIAGFMNSAGFNVLLIDRTDKNIGGDCLNFGCVPSKALIHSARSIYQAKQVTDFGLEINGQVDFTKVKQYIKDKQSDIRVNENADYLSKKGMTVVLGEASFVSRNEVAVGGVTYSAKKIILATGLSPRKLDLPGVEKVKIYNNENIFDIEKLPSNLLIIGGGPIGIEIAQAFNYLGSKVSVIQNTDLFLNKEDKDISSILLKQLKKEGINFYCNYKTESFSSEEEIVVTNKDGQKETISFDTLFVAIGREARLDGLNLEKAGIEMEGRRIKVDKYLRTTNKNILLVGDIAGNYQFTHAAELHASIILNNFFSPFKKAFSFGEMPWVTYTYPEIATFGFGEDYLKKNNLKYEVLKNDFSHNDRAIVDNYPPSLVKLFVSKGKLLGGTMIAPNAGELIQELILVSQNKLDLKKIFTKIYPYPTATRINRETISAYFSSKLTAGNKKILSWLFH